MNKKLRRNFSNDFKAKVALKPHAVTQIEQSENVIPSDACTVTYNFFNQPIQIVEGDYRLTISYGADQQRNKTIKYEWQTLLETTYYVSKYYEKQDNFHYHYIYGDEGVVAVYHASKYFNNMYYIHTDHLGSYCAFTNAKKYTVIRNWFDIWGNCPTLSPQRGDTLPPTQMAFEITGHEHYPEFCIINMNGRLYDPVIGRFFSPDNFVQTPEFTQGFNRYSYCLNNPLKYTDPSGMLSNPIFDFNGNFLGTDDRGLQGEAIIMNKENFRQNMRHSDAVETGYFRNQLPKIMNQNILDKIDNQVSSFPNRPDWNGYLTDSEARNWYRNGNGQPLFVDQSKINLGLTSTWNFRNNTTITRNFFFALEVDENTAKVYGTLTLSLLNPNTGEVKIGKRNSPYIDTYDLNGDGRFFRDIATWGARRIVGEGTPFNIYGYGKNPKVFQY